MNQQEKNRAVSLGVQEAATSGNFERGDALISPDLKAYVGSNALSRAEWIGMGRALMEAFGDARHVWDFVDAAGDYVLLHGSFTGTHKKAFQGIPATGKTVKFSLTIIDRVKDGKLVEHRINFDSAALMQQLTQ
jgi:predicted ester cyclase